jgi:cytochrome P450
MNATDPKTNKLMNTTDVRYNLLTFITAGHETTALALTWTFYLLSLHPEVERRVTSEIAGATAGRPVCADHLEMLPYTTQVIHEDDASLSACAIACARPAARHAS